MAGNFPGQGENGNNPFFPTKAAPVEPAGEQFIAAGHSLPAGNGWQWIVSAWDMFKAQPLPWLIAMIVFGVLWMIPLINLLISIFGFVLMGGAMLAADRQRREGKVEVADFLSGFQTHFGQLTLLGIIAIGVSIVMALVLVITVGSGFVVAAITGGNVSAANISFLGLGIGVLLCLLISFLLYAALWFAPALVVLQQMNCVEAMISSFKICLGNIGAFLIYGIALMILTVLAIIPAGLGLLVLFPVIWISIYTSYRDIFIAE